MDGLLHQRGSLLHLFQTDVRGAGDVDEHALGAVDGGVQQGGGDGHLGGLLGLALAGGPAHAHVGIAGILHHGGHIGEVQIDKAGVPDQIGDGLHRLAQHVVGDLKGVGEGDLLVGGVFQPLVGNDYQAVHLFPQLGDAALGVPHTPRALPLEGGGHHAHGEDALLPGDLRHDGRRAGAGAAAHARGDEHHVGVLQCLGKLVTALLGGLAAHVGVGACALAAGELLADLNFIIGAGGVEGLLVRIHGHKIHALHTAAYHAVHHVIAAAANTYYLDADHVFRAGFQSESHIGSSLRIHSKRDKRPVNHYILVLYNGFSTGSRGIMGFTKKVYRREKPPACAATVSVFTAV